ncbi:E3 ubiquitin-protein ligase RING1-like [Pyrus ussuriensis x Pyrus communis]|uniref:E3 ubiquitin-protein ligase RING1-like n=1 Tax=Pyrus ussuriensis x Pyrus communis TaxID=2448454 RepID=A0A5N5F4J4_9ROSA|nr:E3 ubiquitin-protein ligase RING1-like [Pyrus ussuriensis x Pyrus communis]KAB2604127.1 E3 ubiquitin-protein ligase RING1-like [Pyrus ussuriensis x Pyrus communis]
MVSGESEYGPALFLIIQLVAVIAIWWCCRCCCENIPPEEPIQRQLEDDEMQKTTAASSTRTTTASPVIQKYEKGVSLVGDGTCAVCIEKFEEGEYFRTLPECKHSFHAACIDMWLYSHPNCPVCRATATLFTVVVQR